MTITALIVNFCPTDKGPIYDYFSIGNNVRCLDGIEREVESIVQLPTKKEDVFSISFKESAHIERVSNVNRIAFDEV